MHVKFAFKIYLLLCSVVLFSGQGVDHPCVYLPVRYRCVSTRSSRWLFCSGDGSSSSNSSSSSSIRPVCCVYW